MKRKRVLKLCLPVIMTGAAGLSTHVDAEGFSLDAVNESLTAIQKTAESSKNTTEALEAAGSTGEVAAVQGSLTETLVNKLGITTEQAQGGAGAIFQTAKGKLDDDQFAALSKSVPEMDTLLSAAPKQSGSLEGLSSEVSAVLGDDKNAYGNLVELAPAFKELKLSPEMADQFVPVVIDYVRKNGGASTADMLQSALYGI